jgi:hypothetical protein
MMPCKWKVNSCAIHRVIKLNVIGSLSRFGGYPTNSASVILRRGH